MTKVKFADLPLEAKREALAKETEERGIHVVLMLALLEQAYEAYQHDPLLAALIAEHGERKSEDLPAYQARRTGVAMWGARRFLAGDALVARAAHLIRDGVLDRIIPAPQP